MLALAIPACNGNGSPTPPKGAPESCGGFPDWATSACVPVYPIGSAYLVRQANCSGFGHSGFWKYGYDFEMPIGTSVTAARDGIVDYAYGGGCDGDVSQTNLVVVEHASGTFAVYSHLTQGGALVAAGDAVQAGDPIGRSGNSGDTGGIPHLHFSVHACGLLPGLPGGSNTSCPTLPVTSRNTTPNPQGLIFNQAYQALPFG